MMEGTGTQNMTAGEVCRELIGNVVANNFNDLASFAEMVAEKSYKRTEKISLQYPGVEPSTKDRAEAYPEYLDFLRDKEERIRKALQQIESNLDRIEI